MDILKSVIMASRINQRSGDMVHLSPAHLRALVITLAEQPKLMDELAQEVETERRYSQVVQAELETGEPS